MREVLNTGPYLVIRSATHWTTWSCFRALRKLRVSPQNGKPRDPGGRFLVWREKNLDLKYPRRRAIRVPRVRDRIGRFDTKDVCSLLDGTSIDVLICEDEDASLTVTCMSIYRNKHRWSYYTTEKKNYTTELNIIYYEYNFYLK